MADSRGAVVLLSGGLDSSVLVHYVVSRLGHVPVHALSFNYGQRHSREIDCAHTQAEHAGAVVHQIIDISFLGPLLRRGSTLLKGGKAVPDLVDLSTEELEQPPTYVPNRNMLLLAIAAAYAEAQGIREVFYGAQAHDEYGYWDCTAEFLQRLNATLGLNRREAITIRAPFIAWAKRDVVAVGADLGVDFSDTWSCYRGEARACGVCPTCVERAKAFAAAQVEDPLAGK